MADAAKILKDKGYYVVPVPWMDQARRAATRSEFKRFLHSMPEFKKGASSYVLGGFSALGNPSSFHNPLVRKLRQYAMHEVVPILSHVAGSDYALEQVIDRMLFRPKGQAATGESWHRDEALRAKPKDKMFGGWWNFNDANQLFSCIPGSHKDVKGNSGAGFNGVTDKAKIKEYNEFKKVAYAGTAEKGVVIPPGHIIIFYEKIVHEVVSAKAREDQYRLFLGWRLTKERDMLCPVEDRFATQAVMPLKSGQIPPMYAKLHWTNWRPKIVEFSKDVKPECYESRRVNSGKDEGMVYNIVQREMRSLYEYKLPLYDKYEKHELAMHHPRREWKVLRGEDDTLASLSMNSYTVSGDKPKAKKASPPKAKKRPSVVDLADSPPPQKKKALIIDLTL